MEIRYTLEELSQPAKEIISRLNGNRVVAFYGEMGAGKTTLIKELCAQLGSKDIVSSPTFSVINEYSLLSGNSIYHIDLYRLKSTAEAFAAGVAECLNSGQYCFVEWPDLAPSLLPEGSIHCFITLLSENERKMKINM